MFGKLHLSLAALPLLIALASNVALAAPAPTQTITYNLNLNYQSVFGGAFSAPATLSGDISADAQISRLRGTVYAPLGEERLELDATAPTSASTVTFGVGWQQFLGCDMFGCRYNFGTSTFAQQVASTNVDIRLGTLRGNGTLSWATQAACTADCAPAGAYYYWIPGGYTSLYGGVVDNKDGGRINAGGPAPSIQ